MRLETLEQGLGLLVRVFPNRNHDATIYWELLRDLYDEPFLKATIEICRSQQELYPDTNLIALIRKRAMEISKQHLEFLALPPAEAFSSDPRKCPEWNNLIKELSENMPSVNGRKNEEQRE